MEKTKIIGLTGLFASGKSHVAEIFRSFGAVVQDSDRVAHMVLEESAEELEKQFPAAVKDGVVDRKVLSREVFSDADKLRKLEAMIHPRVREKNLAFIKDNRGKVIVLEIPLLFETSAQEICDHVVFVHVNLEIIKQRALARPGIDEEKLDQILARQTRISLEEKLRRSDFIIENDPGNDTTGQVRKILDQVKNARNSS